MSAYDTPIMQCPYCSHPMEADWVDVGVGMIQCGPYHCFDCHASEIGPESSVEGFEEILNNEEKETGFYRGRISPLANQHNGIPISHKAADALYREKYFAENGNPYGAKTCR